MTAHRALIGIRSRSVFRPARLLPEASTDRGSARLEALPTILLVGSTGSIRRDGCHLARYQTHVETAGRQQILVAARLGDAALVQDRDEARIDVGAVRERRAGGESWRKVARALRIPPSTLRRCAKIRLGD